MTTNNGTATQVHGAGPSLAKAPQQEPTRTFEPGSIEEAYRLAKLLVASDLLPRTIRTPEAAFTIIATGRELGLTAMQSLRSIHVIEGKPSLSADLIAALVKTRSDVCAYFRLVESTDKIATYETHRKGEPSPTRMSFTWEDAQRAGVVGKDNWKRYPAAMLRARAITSLARAVYPDLAMGIYDPDEVAPEPARPTTVGEVEVHAQPAADDSAFAELAERIDEAQTVGALNAIAKDAARAAKGGKLTHGSLESIKTAVTRKRALLADTTPKDPPSQPAEDDGPGHEREPGEEG